MLKESNVERKQSSTGDPVVQEPLRLPGSLYPCKMFHRRDAVANAGLPVLVTMKMRFVCSGGGKSCCIGDMLITPICHCVVVVCATRRTPTRTLYLLCVLGTVIAGSVKAADPHEKQNNKGQLDIPGGQFQPMAPEVRQRLASWQ